MNKFRKYLEGGDLRSIGEADQITTLVKSQKDFDLLFELLKSKERLIAMRAADAAEKITISKPEYLKKHNNELLSLLQVAEHKELKWHLVIMCARCELSEDEIKDLVKKLTGFISDTNESRIVRVFSLQALYDISQRDQKYLAVLQKISKRIYTEEIPSVNSMIRKLRILN